MALKKKITKAEFEKLNEAFKTEYKEDGENFVLDLEGEEDTGALKRAKDRESQLRKDAEKALREAQEQLEALGTDDARKKGDIATLEKSWQSKQDAMKTEYESKLEKFQGFSSKALVDNKALALANELFGKNAAIAMPHVKSRLKADFEGDEPATRVLDQNGQISALTLDDLKKEFAGNKDFASILIASKASGGAGGKTVTTGGADPTKPVDLSSLSPQQMAEHIKAQKEANPES